MIAKQTSFNWKAVYTVRSSMLWNLVATATIKFCIIIIVAGHNARVAELCFHTQKMAPVTFSGRLNSGPSLLFLHGAPFL